jgi:hypothetical protein
MVERRPGVPANRYTQHAHAQPGARQKLVDGVDTYLPSIDEICRKLNMPREDLDSRTITIPTNFFRFILTAFLESMRVDEETYLKDNPDVAAALKSGSIESGRQHFLTNGYFEGRRPGEQPVDEEWYLGTYPDIAVAYRKGRITDLKRHYNETGRFEGRAPNAKQKAMKDAWDNAFAKVSDGVT